MKVTIKKPVEMEVKLVSVVLPVRYGEEDIPKDFPHRKGDVWSALIDIDNGVIIDWEGKEDCRLQMKVCDGGEYTLLGPELYKIATRQDYVPNDLIPGEYGDYVDLKISKDGVITNWPRNPRIDEFFPDED